MTSHILFNKQAQIRLRYLVNFLRLVLGFFNTKSNFYLGDSFLKTSFLPWLQWGLPYPPLLNSAKDGRESSQLL